MRKCVHWFLLLLRRCATQHTYYGISTFFQSYYFGFCYCCRFSNSWLYWSPNATAAKTMATTLARNEWKKGVRFSHASFRFSSFNGPATALKISLLFEIHSVCVFICLSLSLFFFFPTDRTQYQQHCTLFCFFAACSSTFSVAALYLYCIMLCNVCVCVKIWKRIWLGCELGLAAILLKK